MATSIKSNIVGGIYIQSGIGVPNHLSPIGGIFVDITIPSGYLSNGDGNWVDFGSGSGITGVTFSNNTIYLTNSTGGTISTLIDDFTGLTVNGSVTANTISATTYQNLPPITIGVSLDGQGNVITTGSTGYRIVERSGNVTHWYVIGDVTGSTIFDIKRNSTSIIGGGNKPTLSSQIRNDAAPSSWTSVAIAANDELEFIVDSASTITKAWLFVQIT